MAYLDRRLQFRRAAVSDDGFQSIERWSQTDPEADNFGEPIWGSRADVSTEEMASAGWVESSMVVRFVVQSGDFTRAISPKDRLVEGETTFDILGIKQVGRLNLLEITARARMD